MLSSQLYTLNSSSSSSKLPLLLPRPFVYGVQADNVPALIRATPRCSRRRSGKLRGGAVKAEAVQVAAVQKAASVKATVTVQIGLLSNLGLSRGLDDITDMLGKSLLLELVSSNLDPSTGSEKAPVKAYAHRVSQDGKEAQYEAEFVVPAEFGEVGGVLVENEHHKEMHLKSIVLAGLPFSDVEITCNSWVQSKFESPDKRIFFSNKSYLPSQTPDGLKRYREKELENMRGNGQGERKNSDRIYDYDTYNDLGEPETPALARPVLGGKAHPYPRRCRTGRPPCKADPSSETRSTSVYVPRDEQFSAVKSATFSASALYNVLHALVPSLETAMVDSDLGFPYFTAIDSLFNEGVNLPGVPGGLTMKDILPRLVHAVTDVEEGILRFQSPALFNRDRFCWYRDEEFGRQTLAGLNPSSIQLVTEWPLKSKLDPAVYGPPESAITTELIQQEIGGFISVEEALKQKKLFMIDYHDAFLPYVHKVREIKGTTLYGSRTIFFLMPDETLRPIAIELTRPPLKEKPQWRQVFTPIGNSTASWLWKFAKAHVVAHDAGYHQLFSHWLRTHCCVEPYIIATNRQLSVMHPIYRLLHPHFRYTMEINALAREALINAGGIIESSFSPGKYSIEMSSAIYAQQWQFDLQALPAELISRGMAVEDPSAPHGLNLTIKDYPFANDGLLIWDSIKEWVSDYVNHYYTSPELVKSDQELQSWWTEIRTTGHADKKDEPWWPKLDTKDDLISILTSMIWTGSGYHAAVNFGQYAFGGYFPNRPTIARKNMPTEDPNEEEWNFFIEKPEVALLQCFPSQIQATKVMAILDVLSSHSPDEEYLGEKAEPAWEEEAVVKAAFERFSGRLKEIEGIIDGRNADEKMKNRYGAGIVPYELLKPYSEPGVTSKGVPTSISI